MNRKLIIKLCGVVISLSGLTLLFSTLFPILSYEWEAAYKYPNLVSPLVEEEVKTPEIGSEDFTKLSNWFEGGKERDFITQKVRYYTISIPKLKIENATVEIGSESLKDSLIQYPGTALPGKTGNSVIFGHSVLPQYFNPKNYLSIFSTLHRLKKGDAIYADYDGITYKFQVENMFEVKPTALEILEQDSSDSYLTLVTCAPPGDPRKQKRLIVRAKLIQNSDSLGYNR